MKRCSRAATANAGACTIVRCSSCGNTGCTNETCRNFAFGAQCCACGARARTHLTGRWADRVFRWGAVVDDPMEPFALTEPLWPKYLGLLGWVLAIYLTSLLPEHMRQESLLGAVTGFVVWFAWDCQRRPRELKRHLRATAERRRMPRQLGEEVLSQ